MYGSKNIRRIFCLQQLGNQKLTGVGIAHARQPRRRDSGSGQAAADDGIALFVCERGTVGIGNIIRFIVQEKGKFVDPAAGNVLSVSFPDMAEHAAERVHPFKGRLKYGKIICLIDDRLFAGHRDFLPLRKIEEDLNPVVDTEIQDLVEQHVVESAVVIQPHSF